MTKKVTKATFFSIKDHSSLLCIHEVKFKQVKPGKILIEKLMSGLNQRVNQRAMLGGKSLANDRFNHGL